MGAALILVALAGFAFGLVNLIRPLGRLRIQTRKHAGAVLGGSFVVATLGGALAPPAVEAEPTIVASETTLPQESTTSSSAVTTTTATATTTTTPLPSIPLAEVVFAPPTAGLSGDPAASPPSNAEMVVVASITDGDTIKVTFSDGTTDAVRLIGINSPESRECFATEAALVLATLIPVGSQIGMTTDVSDRDQFDRLLRYLWLGGMGVNEEMVRRGAAIARQYPPDTAMAARLDEAQLAAQGQQLGLWNPSACGPDAGTEIVVVLIEADAPGDDNFNLNGEYVRIFNTGDFGVDLTGWCSRTSQPATATPSQPVSSSEPEPPSLCTPGVGQMARLLSTGAVAAPSGTTTGTPPSSRTTTATSSTPWHISHRPPPRALPHRPPRPPPSQHPAATATPAIQQCVSRRHHQISTVPTSHIGGSPSCHQTPTGSTETKMGSVANPDTASIEEELVNTYEYDIEHFALVEKWNPKKQTEKMRELVTELNAKGSQGWELLGLHAFELVGGITGSSKGTTTLTIWKREVSHLPR